MRLSRWLGSVGVLVVIGCLQVAQRTAIFLQGYRVGTQVSQLQTQGADVSWLSAQVAKLSSPAHLADVVQERRMTFVAWSTVDAEPAQSAGLVRVAAAQDDTSD